MKKLSKGRRLALGGLVATTAAAGMVVAGATGASAGHVQAQNTDTTVTVFNVTMPGWHSVKIPAASCPEGYALIDRDYSPGRIVPRGVEVIEPGSIGVHINWPSSWSYIQNEDGVNWEYRVNTGLSGKDITEATNWDPFGSHDLKIQLHCTTDMNRASISKGYVRQG